MAKKSSKELHLEYLKKMNSLGTALSNVINDSRKEIVTSSEEVVAMIEEQCGLEALREKALEFKEDDK